VVDNLGDNSSIAPLNRAIFLLRVVDNLGDKWWITFFVAKCVGDNFLVNAFSRVSSAKSRKNSSLI